MELFNLTRQEIRILQLICTEKSNQEIAEELYISKSTVEWHKNQLIEKTGSKNVVGLVMYAIKQNLIKAA